MKTTGKRLLSLLLSLLLLCSAASVSAQAAGKKQCTCDEIPRIFVPGIGKALYLNYGTPEEEEVAVADLAGLPEQLLPAAMDIIAAVAAQSWDKGADALSKLVYGLFGHLQVDEKGNSVQPISVSAIYDAAQDHKTDHDYTFHYDWRLDPMQAAVDLNTYIKEVRAGTGHSKVVLMPHSEGGLVTMAYLAQFGTKDVEHFIISMSAHNGLTMIGELFNKNISLDADIAAEYLRSFAAAEEGPMALLGSAAGILQESGLLELLVRALAILLDNVQEKLFHETLLPLFLQWPALWGFLPEKDYASAKKAFLGDPKYSDFIKMIDRFHDKAGPGKADELIAAAANKTKVTLIAGYGFAPMPFHDIPYDTDGLIDTATQSSGATTSGIWAPFPERYKQKVNDGHNHVSADRRIDASTCLLPEQTWFLKQSIHFEWDDTVYTEFVNFLVNSNKQPTVFGNKKFPQFLTRLPNGSYIPTVAEEPTPERSLAGSVLEFATLAGQLAFSS